MVKANITAEINLTVKLLSRLNKLELTAFTVWGPLLQVTETQVLWFTLTLSKFNLQEVRNNFCELSGLLIVDENVELVDSKQKLKIVLSIPNTTLVFSPVSLLQNTMLAFKRSSR